MGVRRRGARSARSGQASDAPSPRGGHNGLLQPWDAPLPYGRYETIRFPNLRCGLPPQPSPPRLPVMSEAASASSAAPAHQAADSLEVIRKFAETYAQRTGTYFCSDPGVTAVVLEGLARHKDELGGALCPCRHYEDKEAEVAQAFWNCPCVPMRERKECHCMLFLTEDNPFRGEKQTISLEEVKALTAG